MGKIPTYHLYKKDYFPHFRKLRAKKEKLALKFSSNSFSDISKIYIQCYSPSMA